MPRPISRREFLRVSAMAVAGTTLVACAVPSPAAPAAPGSTDAGGAASGPVKTVWGRVLPDDAAPWEDQVYLAEPGAEPAHLDPARDIYSGGGLNICTEPLVRRDENQQIVPALAESWKVADDATYVEFTIREGAKWSDGKPVTSDDFIFAYQHMADPAMANPWAWYYYDIKGFKDANTGAASVEDIGAEKIDDRTFRVYGNGPTPHLLSLLSYQAAVPVPAHVAKDDPEHWAASIDTFVGCGPWKPVEWEHNRRLVFEPNEFYNGPHQPGIRRIVQTLVPAGSQFDPLNSFLANEVDLLHLLNAQQVLTLRADPKTAELIHSTNNFQSAYLQLDTLHAPLDNLQLRQALSHAIDRETLSTKVMQGTTVPGYSMLPPGFPAYNAELKSVQNYDVDAAKKLLAEAGYADGKDSSGTPLTLEIFSNGRDMELEFVKEQWETNLGITVNLTVLEGGVWAQRRAEHSMQIYRGPYEYDYLDPANMLTSLWRSTDEKGSPRHSWINKQFDDLVNEAGTTADDTKRIDLYQQAERILVEDVGGIFLSHQVIFQVWWPYITGIHPDSTGNVIYRWLDIALYQMYIRNDVGNFRQPA